MKNSENNNENMVVNFNTMNSSKEDEIVKDKSGLSKNIQSDNLQPIGEFENKGKINTTDPKIIKQYDDKYRYAKFNLKNFKNFTLRTPKDYHKRESNKSLK